MKNGLFKTNINEATEKITQQLVLMKLYNDIKTSMNKSEITITIFADYSKAFDNINFYTLIQKMHTFNFSKDSLY